MKYGYIQFLPELGSDTPDVCIEGNWFLDIGSWNCQICSRSLDFIDDEG
jgi:hypothetical protein